MKKRWLCGYVLICGLAVPPAGWAATAREKMKMGAAQYEKGEYQSSAQAFDEAAQGAGVERVDPAAAFYNEGNALFKQAQFDAAAEKYRAALQTTDLALQSKAYYNRGNALVGSAGILEQQQKLEEAGKSVDEALAMYENAMALASADEDVKVNYELALKKQEELKKKQEQQQQQQQQNKDQQKQDQKDQKQQDQKNQQDQQQKQDQQQQDQQKQDQQKQDQQKQNQSQKPEQQKQDQQQQEQRQQAGEPEKAEAMTPEEAKMVLDSKKQEEQANRDRLRLIMGQPVPVDKDW